MQRDLDIGGHPGFERAVQLEEANFDTEDLVVALVAALDIAGGELSLAVDLLDLAGETSTFQAIHKDFDGLADPDQSEARFREVDTNPGLIRFEEAGNDLARLEKITRPNREDFDAGPNGCCDLPLFELDANLCGARFRFRQLSACFANLLRPGPGAHKPFGLPRLLIPLGCRAQLLRPRPVAKERQSVLLEASSGCRLIEPETGRIELLLRDIPTPVEPFEPRESCPGAGQLGLARRECRFRLADLF